MGEPVKIYDLAKKMISLSGREDVEIIETGLRPGEKLYEELLVKNEEIVKTQNKLIFIEKDNALSYDDICNRLNELKNGVISGNPETMRNILKKVVPTFTEN